MLLKVSGVVERQAFTPDAREVPSRKKTSEELAPSVPADELDARHAPPMSRQGESPGGFPCAGQGLEGGIAIPMPFLRRDPAHGQCPNSRASQVRLRGQPAFPLISPSHLTMPLPNMAQPLGLGTSVPALKPEFLERSLYVRVCLD